MSTAPPEEKSLAVPAHGHLRYRLTPQPAGRALRSLARDADVRPQPRHLHRPIRASSTSSRKPIPAGTTRKFSSPPTSGSLLHRGRRRGRPRYHRGRESAQGCRGQESTNPTAGRSAISASPSTAKRSATANRCACKQGQRVLFHILNGSATENIELALPGHQFQIVALDGNPVPSPQ